MVEVEADAERAGCFTKRQLQLGLFGDGAVVKTRGVIGRPVACRTNAGTVANEVWRSARRSGSRWYCASPGPHSPQPARTRLTSGAQIGQIILVNHRERLPILVREKKWFWIGSSSKHPPRPKSKGSGQPIRTRGSLANGRTVEGAWGQSRGRVPSLRRRGRPRRAGMRFLCFQPGGAPTWGDVRVRAPFGFLAACGRLPKARRGQVYCAPGIVKCVIHHHQLYDGGLCVVLVVSLFACSYNKQTQTNPPAPCDTAIVRRAHRVSSRSCYLSRSSSLQRPTTHTNTQASNTTTR